MTNNEPFDLEEMEDLEEIDSYLRSKEWYEDKELDEIDDWLDIVRILGDLD